MEKRVQILLVEDELIIADYMQDILEKLGYEVCATCISYDEAVAALAQFSPDLALVDISLKGAKSGIDLGQYIKLHYQMPFVFATSHSDKSTVDKAKQALPYAYLIKPFNEDDLYAVIETALMHFSNKKQASNEEKNDGLIIIHDGIFVKVRNRFVKLSLDDLLYIEANDNYCTLVTKGGSYVLKTTLKGLLDLLPGQFWRIHRSYVINLNHLKGFDTNEVWVPEKSLPLGKSFYPLLMERLKIVHG